LFGFVLLSEWFSGDFGMFNFNAYVSSFFNKNVPTGTKASATKALANALETLQKQISLINPANAEKTVTYPYDGVRAANYGTNNMSIVVDPSPIMASADEVKTGEAFSEGLDRMTGTVLLDQLIEKQYQKECGEAHYKGNHIKRTFYALLGMDAAQQGIQNWPGFMGPLTKAVTPTDGADAYARAYAAKKWHGLKDVFSILHANWATGGKAGFGPFTEGLFRVFSELCVPTGAATLLEAIEAAYTKLESILKNPPEGDKGEKGEKGEEGQDGGEDGDKGDDGAEDGDKGDEGADGAEDGDKGDEGADGADGAEDGDKGDEGADGAEDGDKGDEGADGQDGEDGEDGASGGASSDSIGNKPMTDREIQDAIQKWKEQNKNTEDDDSEPKEIPLHELKTRSPMRDAKFTNDGKKLPSVGTKVSECPLRQEDKDEAAKIGKVKSVVWQSLTEFVDGAKVDLAEYQKWIRNHKRQIDIIAENIHIPPTAENQEEYGRRSGDIDEGSLWTIGAGLSDGRLFMRNNVINKANKLIVILLDLSGSMGGLKIQEASQVVLLLTEALKSLAIPGLDFVVYGHTGDNHGQGSIDMVRILDSHTDETMRLASGIRSCNLNNNYDGFAFQAAINEAESVYPDCDDRNLIVISDGEPAGYAYGYMHGVGIAHTASVVQRNRGRGWKINGIGICSAFPQTTGDNLYGKGNCVILDDTMGSVRVLARHIKKICE
jgi:hypothetical protein